MQDHFHGSAAAGLDRVQFVREEMRPLDERCCGRAGVRPHPSQVNAIGNDCSVEDLRPFRWLHSWLHSLYAHELTGRRNSEGFGLQSGKNIWQIYTCASKPHDSFEERFFCHSTRQANALPEHSYLSHRCRFRKQHIMGELDHKGQATSCGMRLCVAAAEPNDRMTCDRGRSTSPFITAGIF